ncbi:insulinase family protein [Candidatus Woesebacteria bacterium]|jgi:predicted Zn-dependent peptidase|nr:insulinase family protein [Candidatus Woesebacteria bacterium]
MNTKKITLPNGLRLLVTEMPSLQSVTVTVWVRVGSRYETPEIAGISHFLEHMVFKGGKKYTTAKAVSEAVDALGGEFNAGTSKEWTNFYIKARAGSMAKAIDILADMTTSPKLATDDIERERGVIIEEMNMYEDTPMYRIGDIFDQVMYPDTKIGLDIIGNKETIKKISQQDFIDFRNTYYDPGNIVVTIAGGVTATEAEALTSQYFGHLVSHNKAISHDEFVAKDAPHLKLINKKNEQAHFIVGFPTFGYGDETNRHVLEVLTTVLGEGMSSRLFTEVREKRGLAYSVRSSADFFMDAGSIGTYAGVDPKKAEEALTVILKETYSLAHKITPISDEELSKAKEYIKGHIALSLENTKSVNNFFGYDELLLTKTTTPEDEYKAIDAVTVEQIYALAQKIFVPEQVKLAIIGPFEDQKPFEKILTTEK